MIVIMLQYGSYLPFLALAFGKTLIWVLFFQMQQLRREKLIRGINEDDTEIHRYERILGYNKRKSKNMPKVFRAEGLDCLCFTTHYKYILLFLYLLKFNLDLRLIFDYIKIFM